MVIKTDRLRRGNRHENEDDSQTSLVTYDSDDQSDKPGQEGFRSEIANSICYFEEGRTERKFQ